MGNKKKNKKPPKPAEVRPPDSTAVLSSAEFAAAAPAEPPAKAPGDASDSADFAAAMPPAETAVAEERTPAENRTPSPAANPRRKPAPPAGPHQPETPFVLAATPRSRLRRMLPDLLRVFLAISVLSVGVALWFKPPLFNASAPITTFQFKGGSVQPATLYRPVAMQERYYVELPEKLANRYQWFAIDRRREVVALCEEPPHRFLGKKAIRRGDPLGLDLEFRDIDGSEWLIYFYTDSIVFSNNVLAVRLDIKKPEKK